MKQYEYISVYKSDETDFSHNGIRILCPTECKITEVLNGEYSLTLTHPFDDLGNWKFLIEYNIIKVQGQLFRIYRKSTSMSSDGTKQRTVDAMHIFYDLNFYFIRSTQSGILNGPDALNWIMSHTYDKRSSFTTGKPTDRFKFFSDLKGDTSYENMPFMHSAYYEDMSPTKALLGADNCFINVWGGEIIRDNFNVTINKQRGMSNAFNISYGVDMTEIDEDVDLSDYCGDLYWVGKYTYDPLKNGEEVTAQYNGIVSFHRFNLPPLPVAPMKSYQISLTETQVRQELGNKFTIDDVKSLFNKKVQDYMLLECSPVVNYRVTFANLVDFDLYKGFINLQRCELGDIGTIYNEELGINTIQQIVKKTVDGITGEVVSIELGSLRKTITSKGRINGGYDSVRTELIKNEITANNTWYGLGDAGYTMDQLNATWDELAGNNIIHTEVE